MCSEYLKKLDLENPGVAIRYRNKINLIGNIDPFCLSNSELNFGADVVPPITNMDIVSYLVLTHSFYTKEQVKAFKSLSAYKYFEAGFVHDTGCKKIGDLHVIVGKVKHSQKMNVKSNHVWVITQDDGSICTAHCTCMAGLGEVCGHVGAILFSAEFTVQRRETVSCTDLKSSWCVPSNIKEPIVPVAEMEWGKQKKRRGSSTVKPPTQSEIDTVFKKLEESGKDVGIMRVVKPFCSKMAQEKKQLPLLFNIFKEELIFKSYAELCSIANEMQFMITAEDCKLIEENTRSQSECIERYRQRSGRITASKFKQVCRTNIKKPSLSLLKAVCYPQKFKFYNKATAWGLQHENVAVKAYLQEQGKFHANLIVDEVGFLIDPDFPQIGASPDRLVSCDCCGYSCLEIKCPYTLHTANISIREFANLKSSCLINKDDSIVLDEKHMYFFQIQMQMFLSKRKFSDFVVWSPTETFIQRIKFDESFFHTNLQKALTYHKVVILPELLGKYFTSKEGAGIIPTWCLCEGVDDGRPMISCDSDVCHITWFHLECVGLDDIPEKTWICQQCTQ